MARPRLSEQLSPGLSGAGGRLVLVSAPAGFGKTTLLRDWLTGPGGASSAVAWVSLDENDRSAASFWTYVVAALGRAVPGVGAGLVPSLNTGQEPVDELLAGLVNELSVLPGEVTLVLDDYHLADGPGIQPGMTFLVDHLPPQVCLVLSTRADPVLPLARMRARGELTEIRSADLRFTTDEAAAYLNDTTGLGLAADDVAALEDRTEGWVAALQLAALSLRGREDPSGFIATFAGDDRFVVDYLVEEVLDRQRDEVRRFLLETSILDRLTGSLCDAVTGEPDGKAMLERLDRANLFLVPLDDRRRWYRYHHLFADLLRSRLVDEHDGPAELHQRASAWYDQAGDPVAAVRHALAAGDVDRAADLVELAVPELRRNRQEGTLRRWVDELPEEVVGRRPVLAMEFVGALMASNEFDDVERRLGVIEELIEGRDLAVVSSATGGRTGLVVVDTDEHARLPGTIELHRAGLALVRGDLANAQLHAHRAADRAPGEDHLTRASADAVIGLACWTGGDLEAAHRGYAEAAEGLRRLGYISDVLGCSITLADLEVTLGELRQAQRTCEDALARAADDPAMRGTRDMHTALAEIAVKRDDLAAASEHLRRADELGEAAGLPQNPYRWRVALAHVREAEGDLDATLGLLAEAERLYVGDFSPNVRPVPAMRARVLAAAGDVPAALAWARRNGLSPDDELSYLHEYEHLTLARILLAHHARGGGAPALGDSTGLLERLLAAAETGGRHGTVIEVLAPLALAHQAAGDAGAAYDALERALALAEPETYARVFTREGKPMAKLLTALFRRGPERPYVRELLDTIGHARPRAPEPAGRARSVPDGLVDPLTGRERDVLRLLASDLDGPSIARELVLSLNTVRTHTKNLYAKLGVTNRRAAVTRAHQLNLLSRSRS